MSHKTDRYLSSIFWNLLLITAGSFIFAVGVKSIVVPKGMITGGITGISLLFFYWTQRLSPGIWYFLINIPIFLLGWVMVSRRFFLYSVYGMVASALALDLIRFTLPIGDPFLAMLAGGAIMGAGAGTVLHSLGSIGGNDIIAIILNQKFGLRIGTFFFIFNMAVFACSFGVLDLDLILYSLSMSFVTSQVLDHVLGMFNQRKMVLIVSETADAIASEILHRLRRGATFLEGTGTYTGKRKKIILTVVHNYQLKRLEEAVFALDPEAFMITENTFNVYGKGFSRRKVY